MNTQWCKFATELCDGTIHCVPEDISEEHFENTTECFDHCKMFVEAISVPENKIIHIEEKRYKELIKRNDKLIALENFGVDNWDGYDAAMESINWGDDEEE